MTKGNVNPVFIIIVPIKKTPKEPPSRCNNFLPTKKDIINVIKDIKIAVNGINIRLAESLIFVIEIKVKAGDAT